MPTGPRPSVPTSPAFSPTVLLPAPHAYRAIPPTVYPTARGRDTAKRRVRVKVTIATLAGRSVRGLLAGGYGVSLEVSRETIASSCSASVKRISTFPPRLKDLTRTGSSMASRIMRDASSKASGVSGVVRPAGSAGSGLAACSRTSSSVCRTESLSAWTFWASRTIWSSVRRPSRARACPSESRPSPSMARIGSGSCVRRSVLVTAARLLPSRRASWSLVRSKPSMRAWYAAAVSRGLRFSRWRFSTSASSMDSLSPACRIRTGTRSRPASLAARSRLSPAISSKPPGVDLTTSGCRTPTSRIEAASSSMPGWGKVRRGWRALGRMAVTGSSSNLRPPTPSPVAIRAESPRPRPRLPTAHHLLGHGLVGLGACAARRVPRDGQSEARGLAEPYVPRHYRLVHPVPEKGADLLRHLPGQVGPRVVHREQDTTDSERGVQLLSYHADALHELGESLQRVVLTLHGNQDLVGGRERIERQEVQ